MAYDTIKLRSPALDRSLVAAIEQQCLLRSGQDMASGEILYELFTGELLGSWDSRISVVPKYEEHVLNKNGRPELRPCEPYLLIEASAHKIMTGHNVYGGPTDFQQACSNFIALVETLLQDEQRRNSDVPVDDRDAIVLPPARQWIVHRVDVALVYRLSKAACKEFFDGIQLISFPRRKSGSAKYSMAVYFAGKTTTVKFYHKGTEFQVHERSRLRNFFSNLFMHMYGVKNGQDLKNKALVERKLSALQRLADNRLRVEVEIHSNKFQYDFEKNPCVEEVTDEYLQRVYDKEVEKLLRDGKQAMDTVRESRAVLLRLRKMYGDSTGARLYGFWSSLCTLGDEVTREQFAKTVFYRNRKHLEDAGVSWRGTDVVVVANDSLIPADFAPVRSDKRLCFLPARNRQGYQVSREFLRLAA